MDLISYEADLLIAQELADTYLNQISDEVKYEICHNLWLMLYLECYSLINVHISEGFQD